MKPIMTLAFLLMAGPVYAAPPVQNAPKAPVKLTKSKICHGVDSPWYARISNFKTFKTMAACLAIEERGNQRSERKRKGASSEVSKQRRTDG